MRTNVRIRRRYFINRAFPPRFILNIAGLVMAGSIFSGLVLYFSIASRLNSEPEAMYHNAMAALMPAVVLTQLIVSVIAIFIAFHAVLLLSRRIAGPLYRLERAAERVGRGDLTVRIGIRRKDALLPFKSSFQKMIDNLQYRLLRIRDAALEMKDIGAEAQLSIESSSLSEKEKERLRLLLREYTDRYENSLREFTLPPRKPREECPVHE